MGAGKGVHFMMFSELRSSGLAPLLPLTFWPGTIQLNVAQGWHVIVIIHNLDDSRLTKFQASFSKWEEGSLLHCRCMATSLRSPLPNPLE